MSRTIHNPNLARLCRAHALSITQLAAALKCNRDTLRLYASGRKAMPLLEEKLAAIFKIKVLEFRKIIFSQRRLNDRKFAACFKTVHRRTRVFWRYDRETGREQWRNHGERLANDPEFNKNRAEGMRRLHGAEIRGRCIGGIAKIQLWA